MESTNNTSTNYEVVPEDNENQSSSNQNYFSELPWHVVLKILLKLPIEALIRCRYVCKVWRVLLLDPSFAKLHQSTTPTGVVLQSCSLPHGNSGALYLLHEPQEKEGSSIIAKFNHFPYRGSVIVNSCNGLICSCDTHMGNPIYISNPITGEYLTLPTGKMKSVDPFVSGFGFSPKTKQYKVIRYFDLVEIYTLGSGTWRTIGHVPLAKHRSLFGTFLNGALHWLVKLPNGSKFIRSFDLDGEQFQQILLPSRIRYYHSFETSNLGVLRDCLSLSAIVKHADNFDIRIWVMKQYGLRESWVKEFVIKCPSPIEPWCNPHAFQVINFLKNGEILLNFVGCPVICNIAQGSFRVLKPNGTILSHVKATAHSSTFVSLKDAAMGECTEVLYY